MNGDTFSRIEAWMARTDRLRREIEQEQEHEHADRVAEQIVNVRNVSPLAMLSGVSAQEAIDAFASSVAREKRTVDACADHAHLSCKHELMISMQRAVIAERDQRIAHLERELADLRAAQQSADPTGAHPYRSAPQTATAGPSSPVAASKAPPTPAWSFGGWHRVYGALRRVSAVGRALRVPIGAFVVAAAMAPGHVSLVERAVGSAVLAAIVGAVVASEHGT